MSAVIVVHGGAWAIPDDLAQASVAGVKAAAQRGFLAMKTGASALEAVELAVRTMEDDPVFDAGHGAVLNADGEVELDAIIMDGRTLAAGAVSCTNHVMLTDRGANRFAQSIGIQEVSPESLVTEQERREWEKNRKYSSGVKELFNSQWGHDTVGAVALDCSGNVACATSTGGIRNKMVGRVGDSPVIGSGGYADNLSGAASCTGHGESILRVTLARLILFHMEQGKGTADAVNVSLTYMGERVRGGGGAIAVSRTGDWAAWFTTERMAWASLEEECLTYGLNPGEAFKEPVNMH
ncbi:isoaspartyl peptidase/L-asparaginase isoform X2 [Osmerus eperlanus]|uniref:isoaspartyl peptidase/L-asparaginase isoform X2 n=1 Tax=Osmerus eperlanus TaxID=29151 RepID=UPI002E13BE5A